MSDAPGVSSAAAAGAIERAPARIPYLDGWRGLAILTVLAGHFGSVYWRPIGILGGFGVDLFFVLSGRLMAEILFIGKQPLPQFFRRRFARIFPALIVFTTTMAAVAFAAYSLRGVMWMRPWEYVAANTFTINYIQAIGRQESLYLTHIWSLSIEEHCYVIFAFLAVALSRRTGQAKWLLATVGILGLLNGIRLYALGAGGVHQIYWRTDVRLAPAFLSAAMCLWVRDATPLKSAVARALGWLPLPCVALSGLLFFVSSVPVMYTASAVMLAVAVNSIDYAPARLRGALSSGALTRFGLLSYSIYLWQQPVYRHNSKLLAPALVLVVIGLGFASFRWVESPARRWLNGIKIWRRAGMAETVPVRA